MTLRRLAAMEGLDFADVLAVYMLDNAFFRKAAEPMGEDVLAARYIEGHMRLKRSLGEKTVAPYAVFLRRLLAEIVCFPVQGDVVMYGDSFGAVRQRGMYTGVDLFDEQREAGRLRVVAMAGGMVVEAAQGKGDGNYVVIESETGARYRYAHLAYVHADIAVGVRLEAGAPIGYVGDSGADGRSELFPVRLTVSVWVANDMPGGAAWVNPYIFLRLVENK